MNRYTPFWILLQLVFAAPAWSEDCAEIRLDAPGGSMEHIQGRSQAFGTCYAESAVELFDAWRFSHGEDNHQDQSSAVELALRYSDKFELDGFEQGGTLERSLKLLGEIGSCSEAMIDSKIKNLTSKQYVKLVAELQRMHRDRYNERRLRNVPPASRMDGYAVLAEQQRRSMDYMQFQVENYLLLEELQKLSEMAEETSPSITQKKAKLFEQTAAFHCEDYERMISPAAFDVETQGDGRRRLPFKKQLRDAIDLNFSQPLVTAQPVAISYCGRLLVDGRKFIATNPRTSSNECGNHGSVIMGRRLDATTGRCEYLILNSWDATEAAKVYHKDWEVTESGYHIWVDRNAIENATFGYSYLKPAGYR